MNKNILFVCLGNICRSPMAEAIMRFKLKQHKLNITVDSAATSNYNIGTNAHKDTLKMLHIHGIPSDNLIARQVHTRDFYTHKYILAMDRNNILDLHAMAPKESTADIRLLLSVDLPNIHRDEVPDPYYTDTFELTYALIDAATDAWINMLKISK